tara:strand:- start:7 stop:306 length:300 start_codon:yes stop_codon:yes gene_type:complete
MKAKRHPRTAKEIAQDPRVEDMHKEDGSWWIYLKDGFVCSDMECGTIHEDTISEVCQRMKEIITTEEFEKKERDRVETLNLFREGSLMWKIIQRKKREA